MGDKSSKSRKLIEWVLQLPSRRSSIPRGLEWGFVGGFGGLCACGWLGGFRLFWGLVGLFAVGDEVEFVNDESDFAAGFAGFFVCPGVLFEDAFDDDWFAFDEIPADGFCGFSICGAVEEDGFFFPFSIVAFVFSAVGDGEVHDAFFICEELGDGIAGEVPGDDDVVEGDAHFWPFNVIGFFFKILNENTTKHGFCS